MNRPHPTTSLLLHLFKPYFICDISSDSSSHHAVLPLSTEPEQAAGHEVAEAVGPLLPVQPQPPLHKAVHRLWPGRLGDRVLSVPAQGDPGAVVQHYEGDQPATGQPAPDAVSPHIAGTVKTLIMPVPALS